MLRGLRTFSRFSCHLVATLVENCYQRFDMQSVFALLEYESSHKLTPMFINYAQHFQTKIDDVKAEGRYRTFATLERQVGKFPQALYTAWTDRSARLPYGAVMIIWVWDSIRKF